MNQMAGTIGLPWSSFMFSCSERQRPLWQWFRLSSSHLPRGMLLPGAGDCKRFLGGTSERLRAQGQANVQAVGMLGQGGASAARETPFSVPADRS